VVDTVFGLQRPKTEDVVCLHSNDVLRGTVLNETITINTPYGLLAVPLRRCAGLSFEGAQVNTGTIVTTNCNRYTGMVMDRVIHFRLADSGAEIPIRKERVCRILLQQKEDELAFVDTGERTNLFVMANGDLLTGTANSNQLTLVAGFVEVPVFFAEIDHVELQGGDRPVALVTKKTKEVLRGRLLTEDLTVQLDIGVAVEAVYQDKFARMLMDGGGAQAAALLNGTAEDMEELDGVVPVKDNKLAGDELVLTIPGPDKVLLRLRQLPAGTYMMGSPSSEKGRDKDERLHEVVISKPFYMGICEVTQAQWTAVMGSNPSHFKDRPNHPVEQVSWEDCRSFIERLNGMGIGFFRLPTEAEWEYAARAGSRGAYYWGDDDGEILGEYSWFEGNSYSQTREVGTRRPNAWGLYDTIGNVYEWCSDWMGRYRTDRQTDPRGPSGGSYRVYRGGSWNTSAMFCRSALRYGSAPSSRRANLGLRLVREVE
jgi:hypothetical protein